MIETQREEIEHEAQSTVYTPLTFWTYGQTTPLGIHINVVLTRLPRARCVICGKRRVLFALSDGLVTGPKVCALDAGIR